MNNYKSLFDNIFYKIILEENLNQENKNIIYNNMSLGIIPYKFNIPNKFDWDLIMQYCKLPIKKLIIIISNVSKQKVINRKLSKTNLTKFCNILKQIQDNTNLDIKNIKNEILNKIDNLSYKDLLYYCNEKLIPILDNYDNIQDKLIIYLKKLKQILFKNINNPQINIQKIVQILNIYANTYNVSNMIQIKISQEQSPVNDMINIISQNCDNCEIYINTNLEKNNSLIDNLYKNMKLNNVKNIIIPHKIYIKYNNILNNNIFDRENFPDKLSQFDFNKIKSLLKIKDI